MAAKPQAQPPAVVKDKELDKIPARINEIMVPVAAFKDGIISALRRQTHTNITYEDLVADLKTALRINFKLRGCDRNTLAACVMYAARRGLTFGEGGVHLVPRGKKGAAVEQATPIIDYRAKRAICERVLKLRLTVRLVFEAEEERGDFEMEHGLEPVFRHKVAKDPAERHPDLIFGGYWFAEYLDGRKEYDFVDMGELQKHADVSAAGAKGPWGTWREKMLRKTLVIIGANTLMGNYTGGGVDTPDIDWTEDSEAIDAEFEEVHDKGQEGEGQEQSNKMADDLEKRKQEAPPTADLGPTPARDVPPPIPPLPENMEALLKENEVFKGAVEAFSLAYNNIMEDANSIGILWEAKKDFWGKEANTPELNLITQAKRHYFARAAADGFIQAE